MPAESSIRVTPALMQDYNRLQEDLDVYVSNSNVDRVRVGVLDDCISFHFQNVLVC
jgi:hypothetical protein